MPGLPPMERLDALQASLLRFTAKVNASLSRRAPDSDKLDGKSLIDLVASLEATETGLSNETFITPATLKQHLNSATVQTTLGSIISQTKVNSALKVDRLEQGRRISLTGGATGSVVFTGDSDVSLEVTLTNHSHGIADIAGLELALNSKLNSNGNGSNLIGLNATALTSGTIPDARLVGNYTGVNISGNAGTASRLAVSRTITLTGLVTGSVNFDGSSNVSMATSVSAQGLGLGSMATRNVIVSTAAPTGGNDGDIWLQY